MTDQINKTTVLEALGDECGLTRQEKKLRLGFIKNINALPPVRNRGGGAWLREHALCVTRRKH